MRRPPKDTQRLSPVAGETKEGASLPAELIQMPAGRASPDLSMLSVPVVAAETLDVEIVSALLGSHAQAAGVVLRIVTTGGDVLFEATPPGASTETTREAQVRLSLPGQQGLRLRGALPRRRLQAVGDVMERVAKLRAEGNARLHALEAERQRLSLFFDFSEKVYELAAMDEVITRFLADVTGILEAREGTFFALDRRRNDLYIRCHHGSRPDVVRNFRLAIGEGIAGAVAKDRRPRIVNDVQACPEYVAKSNPIRNIICAPVMVRGRLLGVINVNDRRAGEQPFSTRDLELLVSLARLGGIALDNAKLYGEVRSLLLAIVESLTTAISAKDEFSLGHARRVAFVSAAMAERVDLSETERDLLRVAAMLHDIGNLAVPDEVLRKQGPLTRDEREMIKQHPSLGASILSPVRPLSAVLPGIVDHHERYDGRGYPRRLKGEEISLQGRVIAIADTFDAMTHDRSFRAACSPAAALREITSQAGGQFDPAVVPLFVECYRELKLNSRRVEELIPPIGSELDF